MFRRHTQQQFLPASASSSPPPGHDSVTPAVARLSPSRWFPHEDLISAAIHVRFELTLKGILVVACVLLEMNFVFVGE